MNTEDQLSDLDRLIEINENQELSFYLSSGVIYAPVEFDDQLYRLLDEGFKVLYALKVGEELKIGTKVRFVVTPFAMHDPDDSPAMPLDNLGTIVEFLGVRDEGERQGEKFYNIHYKVLLTNGVIIDSDPTEWEVI